MTSQTLDPIGDRRTVSSSDSLLSPDPITQVAVAKVPRKQQYAGWSVPRCGSRVVGGDGPGMFAVLFGDRLNRLKGAECRDR